MSIDIFFKGLVCRNNIHNYDDYINQDKEVDEILMNRLFLINPDNLQTHTHSTDFNYTVNSKIKKSESKTACIEIDTTPTCYSLHFCNELIIDFCNYFFYIKDDE